ncbi:hypothetical protein [Desulfonema magnum]|uniref:hypothetical protein n=1 Tax=Desulfonema magnum TaxID=45655 RepID=UPI001A9C0508|nr:hypothetical protein [Desulfonema magnum]
MRRKFLSCTQKNATIQCGFQVKSSDIEYAAVATSNQLESLPFTLFQSIDLKALSGMVGAIFAMNLSKQVDAIVNPIEKGHPDIIPKSGENASEEELRNYSEGLEIKCTVGNVSKGSELKTGQQRVSHLSGITWQAHHREVKALMGLVTDFSGSKIGDKYFPSISGIFFADNLKIDDWGAISGTTGRNTKVTGMKSSGKKKMGKGWILLLNQSSYISRYQKILSIPA